jgi:bifunctional DNase/RNase
MQKMSVHGVNLDIMTNQPVVILKDSDQKKFLPIWIGQFEATAILMELQGIKPSRPLTHDLIKSMLELMELKIEKIVINDIIEGTFYAQIYLLNKEHNLSIDARPSDAIALAVRVDAPIFAEESVVKKASIVTEEGEEEIVEKFRNFLDTCNPEDFEE